MAVANTITTSTIYDKVLQDRLDHPTNWKEMCSVEYTDIGTISSSYMSTTPSVQSGTRGTPAVLQVFAETAQTLAISTYRELGVVVDLADLAQSDWTKPAELFDRIGALLNEVIETAVLARHASWTDFDNAAIGGAAGNITVSASNIDDIIRGVKREIREANGQFLMNRNGVGFVWRAADFEYLEAFVQANGFMTADKALKEGTVEGIRYLGVDHYWSNDNATNHVMAGVKKVERLGILSGTYGQAHTIDFPGSDTNSTGSSFFSGKAFYSRADFGHLTPFAHSSTLFDVNVA